MRHDCNNKNAGGGGVKLTAEDRAILNPAITDKNRLDVMRDYHNKVAIPHIAKKHGFVVETVRRIIREDKDEQK